MTGLSSGLSGPVCVCSVPMSGLSSSENVWYRSSRDGGKTWSSAVKLNDAGGGSAGYVNADGSFHEVYGDDGEIAVTSRDRTFAAWGEGLSWTGPGGTWFDLQS